MCTGRITEDFDIWFLRSQNAEHHLSGCFGRAVQHPVGQGLGCEQRGDVYHAPPQAGPAGEHLQQPSGESQGGADVQGQEAVHLTEIGEARKLGNVT